MTTAAPHASLRGIVTGEYCGWAEYTTRPARRREYAGTIVPLIINFGPSYRLVAGTDSSCSGVQRGSFVAGVYDTWVDVDSATTSLALQVNLTPLGARTVLQRPLSELSGQSIDVVDLFGVDGARLCERLGNLADWTSRFAVLEQFLRRRVADAVAVPAAMQRAWTMLSARHGAIPVSVLCETTGWSAKRLISMFRDHVGVPPKTAARLLRFEHLVRQLDDPARRVLSARALDAGFYDQSHLTRDFLAFAGTTPGAYLRQRSGLREPETVAAI